MARLKVPAACVVDSKYIILHVIRFHFDGEQPSSFGKPRMTIDRIPVLGRWLDFVRSNWVGWGLTVGSALGAGYLVGLGATGSYQAIWWPMIAGLAVGVMAALTVRSQAVFAALAGGIVVVTTCVVMMVRWQYHIGHWPITDLNTIANYGTEAQATLRITLILLVAACVPCVMAGIVVAYAKGHGLIRRRD